MKKKWVAYNKSYENAELISKKCDVSELLARVIINRGIDSIDGVKRYLFGDIDSLYAPFLCKGIDKAVKIIKETIMQNKKICIYGDYDVDGITSVAIIVKALKKMGASVSYYIPNRMDEGYGLSIEAIKKIKNDGSDLLISVDCGIKSIAEVDFANNIGLQVIITDHHECGEKLPPADVVINPHQKDCDYPFKELAGVGVAYKLIHGFEISGFDNDLLKEIIVFTAIGTIADIVPLIDENRILVKEGLKYITGTKNIGLNALIDVCGLTEKPINSYNVAFMIAPRMNAAGRLSDASLCVELLLTDKKDEAVEIAKLLDEGNKERQSIEAKILEQAIQIIEQQNDILKDKIIILDACDWHVGVIGIVASRIVEKYHLPTILISKDEKIGKASARSITGFNIYEVINENRDLLEKFGGHEQAAGFSITLDNIEKFKTKTKNTAQKASAGKQLLPEILVDYKLEAANINLEMVENLKMLEPFGINNTSPVFVCRNLEILSVRTVGSDGKHLSLNLFDGTKEIKGIGFSLGNYNKSLSIGEKIDIVGSIEKNVWNGCESVQLIIKDIKKASK